MSTGDKNREKTMKPPQDWPWDTFQEAIEGYRQSNSGSAISAEGWEELLAEGEESTYQKKLRHLLKEHHKYRQSHLLAIDHFTQVFQVYPNGTCSIGTLTDAPGMSDAKPVWHHFTNLQEIADIMYHMKRFLVALEAINGDMSVNATCKDRTDQIGFPAAVINFADTDDVLNDVEHGAEPDLYGSGIYPPKEVSDNWPPANNRPHVMMHIEPIEPSVTAGDHPGETHRSQMVYRQWDTKKLISADPETFGREITNVPKDAVAIPLWFNQDVYDDPKSAEAEKGHA